MARPIVSDELWERVQPLIPVVERKFRYPGRKRTEDRKVLTGILFVLLTGIPWERPPQEMGCGSGMTCWRRLKEWQDAGVWQRLHPRLGGGQGALGRGANAVLASPAPPAASALGAPRRHPSGVRLDRLLPDLLAPARAGQLSVRGRRSDNAIAWRTTTPTATLAAATTNAAGTPANPITPDASNTTTQAIPPTGTATQRPASRPINNIVGTTGSGSHPPATGTRHFVRRSKAARMARFIPKPAPGLEPGTSSLQVKCSAS